MIDQETIYQNKVKFIELLTKLNVDLTDFSKFLDKDFDFIFFSKALLFFSIYNIYIFFKINLGIYIFN